MSAQVDQRRVGAAADRQHGVLSREQLLALGLTRHQIGHRLTSGLLRPLYRGVYAVGHRALTREGRWLAAVLTQGAAALLSHASAAALWAIRPTASAWIDITVPKRSGRRPPRNIRLHRVTTPTEPALVSAIPCTTPARTLADLAARLTTRDLERAVEQADRLKLFDLPAVRAAAEGRPGCAKLAQACAAADSGLLLRSDLERAFLTFCRAGALPLPAVNTQIAGLEVDFAWHEQRVAVETDGGKWHGTPWAKARDKPRDRILGAEGYGVLRITDTEIESRPGDVMARVATRL